MSRFQLVSIPIVGLLALSGCQSQEKKQAKAEEPAKAKTDGAKDESSDVVHEKISEKSSLSDDEAADIEADARDAVEHIAKAREAIAAKKHAEVEKDLVAAEKALDDIAAKHPSVHITEKLWDERGKIPRAERDDTVQAAVTEVPVDAAMGDVSLVVREKPRYPSPSPDAPKKKTEKTPERIAEDTVMYTEIDLPVATTRLAVLAAEKLAEEKKWGEVDDVLGAAQSAMDFVVVADDGPLMRLRKHVWNTMASITGGKIDTAKTELTEAKNLAEKLAKNDEMGEAVQKELKLIQAELDKLEQAVGSGSAKAKDYRHLQERVWALTQRWAARGAIAAEDLSVRDPLVDALWRLDLAEDWIVTGDLAEAGGEHLLARAALEEAKDKADAATKPVVEGILARLVELDPVGDRPPEEVLARYSEVQARLRELVFSLDPASQPTHLAHARAH